MNNALLVLSVGPVQGFIAQARRASDLYAGSQLLTKLVDAAIDVIGVDNVLSPRRAENKQAQSLPNKLIAIVPLKQASSIAQQTETKIREKWQEIAKPVREKLDQYVPSDEEWGKIWQTHLDQLPEIYWAVTPWPEGWSYEQVYEQTNRNFNARKALRNFDPIEERGRKCTVCGERAALHRAGETAQEYWRAVAEKVGESKLRPDGKEQLCAVCAVKRFRELEQEHFPSVSEIATVPFKRAILERLQKNELEQEIHGRLIPALEQYTQALMSWDAPTISDNVVPALANISVGALWENFAEKILRYDGEWLFPETYDRKIVEAAQHPQKQQGLREAQRAAQAIIRVARELGLKPPRPTPYYALLFADGDQMGRQIRKAATDGPEKHKEISKALANFAAKEVYRIIESTYGGRVVYAGGDDVVALLPLPTALPAAEALRRTYAEKMAGLLETPTMSAGIAIVHHLSPLSEALKAARQAEHTAKERYEQKNAIAVAFHKRGGAPVMMGAGWEFGDGHQATIDLLLDIQRRFAVADDPSEEIGLSLGLAHTLLDEARFLGVDVPPEAREARQAEVERLLYRAAPGHLPRKVRYEQAQKLAPLLVQLAEAIEKSLKAKEQRCNGSHRALESGLVIVAQWLLLLRFIVQESGAPVMMEEKTQ